MGGRGEALVILGVRKSGPNAELANHRIIMAISQLARRNRRLQEPAQLLSLLADYLVRVRSPLVDQNPYGMTCGLTYFVLVPCIPKLQFDYQEYWMVIL